MLSGYTAIAVAIFAFSAVVNKRDMLMPFIAMAHLCAGLTDLLHAFFARGILLLPASAMDRFIPGSWTAGRITLALILLIGVIRLMKGGARSTGILFGIVIASAITVSTIVLFTVVELPAFILPDAEWVNRPWEIISILLFIVIIVLIVISNKKHTDTDLLYLLIPGLLLHTITQLLMTGSSSLFNANFDASHVLKGIAYAAVLIPVVYSVLQSAKYSIQIKTMLLPSSFAIMAMAMVMFSVVGNVGYDTGHDQRSLDRKQLALAHQLQLDANSMSHSYHEYVFRQSDRTMDEFWIAYDSVYDIFGILKAEEEDERYSLEFSAEMEEFAVYAYNLSKQKQLSAEQIEDFKNKADLLMIIINRLIATVAEHELLDLEQSDAESQHETKNSILFQVYFLMIFLPLIIAIGMWQVRRQTLPITELSRLALRVSRGEYDLTIKGEGKDEIGVLGSSFNRMLKSLNDTMSGLEQNVAQRTNELQVSQQHLQSVLENIEDGIVTTNLEGTIETANNAVDKIFGYENNEIIGKNIKTLMQQKVPAIMGGGNKLQTAIRKNGELFPIEISVTEVVQKERHTLVAIIRDISERKKAETVLMESEERMSRFFKASREGLFFQKEGKILDVNDSGARMLGYRAEEFVGHSLFEFIVPEYHEVTLELMRGNLEDPWFVEVICKDGSLLPVEIQASTHTIDGDEVGIVSVRDVTQRFQAEEELGKQSVFTESVLQTIASLVVVLDHNGKIVRFNAACEQLTGYSSAETMGQHVWDFLLPESEVDNVTEVFSSLVAGDFPNNHRNVWITKSGHEKVIDWLNSAIFDNEGKVEFVIATGLDVTERLLIEEERAGERESLEKKVYDRTQELNTIFTLSPDGFVLIGPDDDVIYVNPAFLAMTGFERHEVMAISIHAFTEKMIQLCALDKMEKQCSLTGDGRSEILYLSRPSSKVLQCTMKKITGAKSVKQGRVLYFRDITHESEVDKMKSEFLSTAAHELRTPLASILGFSELLLMHDYGTDQRKDVTETIHRQSVKLKNLLDELLDLARIEARAGKDFNIENGSLKTLLDMVTQEAKGIDEGHELIVKTNNDWPLVSFDENKTHQALMNVLSNAYKYSEQGTRIICTTQKRTTSKGDQFGISIEDNGIGLTRQEAARVGERFYRADASGSIPGTGLGIALVKEIMEIQKGSVEINSVKDKGTTVTLWFSIVNEINKES